MDIWQNIWAWTVNKQQVSAPPPPHPISVPLSKVVSHILLSSSSFYSSISHPSSFLPCNLLPSLWLINISTTLILPLSRSQRQRRVH